MSIFLGYHYPCLDGAYSLAAAFLFFRDIQKNGIDAKSFIEHICKCQTFEGIESLKVQEKSLEEMSQEEKKSNELDCEDSQYSPYLVKDLIYLPCLLSNNEFKFPKFRFKNIALQDSILILMDFYASSVDSIVELCSVFKKVIILDHHLTFGNILEELKKIEIPKNLLSYYDPSKSGATICLHFFEKLKGSKLVHDQKLYEKLQRIYAYVEDNDIKAEKVSNSDNFVAGIFKRKMNFDPSTNINIFEELLVMDPDILIEIGKKENKLRIEAANQLSKGKKLIYLGGKAPNGEAKIGLCYGLELENMEYRNEVGHRLAELSSEDGFLNFGLVYNFDNHKKMYKLSLRSLSGKEGDCQAIASIYGGGGHYGAAGFYLSKPQFKNWK